MSSPAQPDTAPVPAPPQGRTAPAAPEVERAVLGGILMQGDSLYKVEHLLREDTFYVRAHRLIYEAMNALAESNIQIDLHTIFEQLRKLGTLETVGGPVYLAELTSRVTGAANLEYHAHILLEKWMRRKLIQVATHIAEAALDPEHDVYDALDEAEQMLFEIHPDQFGANTQETADIAQELLDDYDHRATMYAQQRHYIGGLSWGIHHMDYKTDGLKAGKLTVIAARPHMGKTALGLSLAIHALRNNKPVLYFSLEMTQRELIQRMAVSIAGVNAHATERGCLQPHEQQRYVYALDQLSKMPLQIVDKAAITMADMRAQTRKSIIDYGTQLVIVDYLQLISTNRDFERNDLRVRYFSRTLKVIAKDMQVPVVLLSQLNRNCEARPDKRPMMSDLRESGAIEEDADQVVMLFRPEYYGFDKDEEGNNTYGLCELIMAKNRGGGGTGVVKSYFDKYNGRFTDWRSDDGLIPRESNTDHAAIDTAYAQGGRQDDTATFDTPF